VRWTGRPSPFVFVPLAFPEIELYSVMYVNVLTVRVPVGQALA
jgi:hypothetical protein